jgi:4-hydroxyphenylpyruvate dioxygenase-like putative hemolysin
VLKEHSILLDAELNDDDAAAKEEKLESYLLQVFTQPLFERQTLFLEFIQRVGKVTGFGAANIKALWEAVQEEMKKKQTNTHKIAQS